MTRAVCWTSPGQSLRPVVPSQVLLPSQDQTLLCCQLGQSHLPQDVPTLDQAVLQGGERSQPENQPRLSHPTTFFPIMVNTNTDKIKFKLLKMAAKLMNCCQSNLLFISASSPSKSLHEDQGAKVKKMTPCFPIQSEDMREDEEERSLADQHIPAYLLARPEMDLIMCTPPLGCHIVYFRITVSK